MNDVVLMTKNLNKYYGKFHALKNVSFSVNEGEIVGFVGPNGSGKSTTMKCISNLIFPESGEIEICGWSLKEHRDKALSNIASLIESPGLYSELSGQDNLELMAGIKGVGKNKVEEIKEFINIGPNIYKKVSQYSMGMKQRLAIGIALLGEPKVLILDEPTNGLDPTGIIELRNNLVALVKEKNISILFSSHQLGEIEKIADRIIGIKSGEIVPFDKEDSYIVRYLFKMNKQLESDVLKGVEGVTILSVKDNIVDLTLSKNIKFQKIIDVLTVNNEIISVENKHLTVEDIYLEIFGDDNEANI